MWRNFSAIACRYPLRSRWVSPACQLKSGARRVETVANGFTLMEMLVVLVLIGLIAAVAVPQVMRLLEGGKSRAARIQLETVGHSLNYYQLDTGQYPTTEQGLGALWMNEAEVAAWNGPYVRQEQQLRDPWNRPLLYRQTRDGGGYELATFGADGREGGDGENADHRITP